MPDASIPHLSDFDPNLKRALQYLQNCVNNVAQQSNTAPVGLIPPPQPHSAISVVGGGGILDVAVTPANQLYRGQVNFFDYSNDGWKTTHTKPMGPSNNWRGSLGSGNFDVRSYTQHATSAPSEMLYHPTVSTVGDAEPAMQTGQGSGTGSAGFGEQPFTGDVAPKRA